MSKLVVAAAFFGAWTNAAGEAEDSKMCIRDAITMTGSATFEACSVMSELSTLSKAVDGLEGRMQAVEVQQSASVAMVIDSVTEEGYVYQTGSPESAFDDLVAETEAQLRGEDHLEEKPTFMALIEKPRQMRHKVTSDRSLLAAFMAAKEWGFELVLETTFDTSMPTKAPTKRPTAAPTGLPSKPPTPEPSSPPTDATAVFSSQWNSVKLEAFKYSGGSTTLTWDIHYQVCQANGRRVPGSSNPSYMNKYCSYSSNTSVNVWVTSGCNWSSQGFNYVSGAIPSGKYAYACAHLRCDHLRVFEGTSNYSRTSLVTIRPGDFVMCEYQ